VAAWGSPAAGDVLPLTMSVCDFDTDTSGGTTFTPGPPYTGTPKTIKFHGDNGTPTCPKGPAGKNVPGGWGYLETSSGCSVHVSANTTVNGEPGNDPPKSPCDPAMFLNKVVLVPIFDDVVGNGSHESYHLKGFAAFYVTGLRLGGNGSTWTTGGSTGCSGDERCIAGYFVKFVAPGAVFGGPNLGAVIVKMIG
jgi:hypothetical protein